MKLYRIKDWALHYEVSDSKKVEGPLQWVAVRTKTDGIGYLRITQEKAKTDLLAAWYLLLGVAAKQPKAERGKIARDGVPLSPDDLELLTRFPAPLFSKALEFFSDPKQGWLIIERLPDQSESIRSDPDASGQNQAPSGVGGPTVQYNTVHTGQDKAPASPMPLPFDSDAFRAAWDLYAKHRREIKKPLTPTAAEMSLKALAAMGEQRAIRCIEHTISKGWQGLREPDAQNPGMSPQSAQQPAIREPMNWKTFLNHNFPDSRFSANQVNEAKQWSDLDRATQLWLLGQMKGKA